MVRALLLVVLIFATLGFAGCGDSKPAAPGTPTQQVFQVKGVVEEVFPNRKQARIKHETIPNYMDAMTMLFDVKDTNELAGLKPGDDITFRMVVTDDDGWIEQVKRLGTTSPVYGNPPETFRVAREVDPLKVGDAMPEYHFTNQFEKAVSLGDFKGQAVAFTFIFTRCPFPTFCPRMSQNFEAVQSQLKQMSNAPTNWHLLSITIDPAFDTPKILKSYATQYRYDSNKWSYVTGALIDVTAIAEQFGLLFWRPDPNVPAGINHNLRTVVLTASGKVHKIFVENTWKPEDVVAALVEAAKI